MLPTPLLVLHTLFYQPPSLLFETEGFISCTKGFTVLVAFSCGFRVLHFCLVGHGLRRVQALYWWRFGLLCILIPEYMYNISSLFRDRKWLMSSTAFEGGASVGWEGIPGRYGEAGKYINTG